MAKTQEKTIRRAVTLALSTQKLRAWNTALASTQGRGTTPPPSRSGLEAARLAATAAAERMGKLVEK